MDSLFALIFKYQPFYFRNGDFSFSPTLSVWWWLSFFVLSILVLGFLYRDQIRRFSNRRGWLLFALRAGFLLTVMILLLRPTLTLSTLASKEGVLAILVDNSMSMGIPQGDRKRGEVIKDLLSEESSFTRALEEQFHLKHYRFAGSLEYLDGPVTLDWSGEQTDILGALGGVVAENRNLPLGGVVLLTDGADTSYREASQLLTELRDRGVPVHTIGVGPSLLERDVELTQVSIPREVLPDIAVLARVTLRHSGFGGERGRLEVREGSQLVASVQVNFPRDSDTTVAEIKLYPKSEGLKVFDFSLTPLEGEEIPENNSREALLQVKGTRPRILYVEGQPRWEFKFLRQALAGDQYLRFETLLRTALNKFYRQGIEEDTVLAAGFPSTRQELFQYDAILLGNLESAFFSYSQMEILRDFVGQRGGGFLMLGGGSSFSSGNYLNTPLAEMLPVQLKEAEETGQGYRKGAAGVALTLHGANHPALELARDGNSNRNRWLELPDLIDRNQVTGLKPGATVLVQLRSEDDTTLDGAPLLVAQRYGRGLSAVFLSGSSWRWQMLQDHEDQSHETFWRQLLRWLVFTAKKPVGVETERQVYSQRETVAIRAEVSDESFNRINNARVEATITPPEGEPVTVALQRNIREPGAYSSEYSPAIDGLHHVSLEASSGSAPPKILGRDETHFVTSTGEREYFDSSLKSDYLDQLSKMTGGRYYPFAEAEKLPSEVRYVETKGSVTQVFDLWDMPFNLLIILMLLFSEWFLRRRLGTI